MEIIYMIIASSVTVTAILFTSLFCMDQCRVLSYGSYCEHNQDKEDAAKAKIIVSYYFMIFLLAVLFKITGGPAGKIGAEMFFQAIALVAFLGATFRLLSSYK